jgi:hypothetical protein
MPAQLTDEEASALRTHTTPVVYLIPEETHIRDKELAVLVKAGLLYWTKSFDKYGDLTLTVCTTQYGDQSLADHTRTSDDRLSHALLQQRRYIDECLF